MKYVLVLIVLLWPSMSFADPSKELFMEGVGEIASGRYDSAIAIWERVYKLSPNPTTLYSMATAASRAGRPEESVQYINKLLANHSNEEIGGLKNKITASLSAYNRQLKTLNFAKNIKAIQVSERERLREESKVLETWTWKGWTGTTLSILGVGGLATGFFLNQEVVDLRKDLENQNDTIAQFNEKNKEIEDKKNTQQLAIIGGASLLTIGVALIIWDLSTTTETYDVQFSFDENSVGGRFTWYF